MNKKQIIFVIAKIAFASAVLVYLFHRINVRQVWGDVHNAQRLPIFAGIVLCWFTVLVAGLRWHQLLAAFGIGIPLRAVICIAQIGQFFLMFLPGPAGDDLTRMLYISRLAKGRVGEACTTVLLDRCIGLASILVLAVLCIPWQWHSLAASRTTYLLAVGISVAGGAVFLAGILFFLLNESFQQRFVEKWLQRLPPSNIRNEFFQINQRIFTSRKTIAKVMVAAVGTQLILCAVFYLAGRSVGIQSSFSIWIGFIPIVLAASAVPITVAGIGVREILMKLFLGVLAGVAPAQAVAASIIAFAMMLSICLLGGIVYIFYRPAKKA